MGSFASKASRTKNAAGRSYPSRVPPKQPSAASTVAARTKAPPPQTQKQASATKNEAIDLDGRDPTFAASLRSLGAVDVPPHNNPDIPQTSTPPALNQPYPSAPPLTDPRSNPAVTLLLARQRIAEQAEEEALMAGKKGFPGRSMTDVLTLRQVLRMREGGVDGGEIEKRLGLKRGFVGRLGAKGVVGRI